MEGLKQFSDSALASRMVDYIERLEALMEEVGKALDSLTIARIRNEYACLKAEITDDAHYVGLARNDKFGNNVYSAFFSPSVKGAAASGFRTPINSQINQNFISSIWEARYNLTKYYSLQEWQRRV